MRQSYLCSFKKRHSWTRRISYLIVPVFPYSFGCTNCIRLLGQIPSPTDAVPRFFQLNCPREKSHHMCILSFRHAGNDRDDWSTPLSSVKY
ncbi:hypothetical protein BDN72DRAFT_547004 [Pluteus cervinus]|uniref:Uncharacterized protein n=1 Tax=Pluteus cervinus TaxID=181527 RepID=A0ACD3AXG8_9AGAR|nr:hypothetical protein BDN72DRAFT_547004 [Pluteus cervinus]